jgi:cation diffusion facilitator family transporter
MELQRRKTSVAWLSVISNSTLVLLKLTVGFAIGSVAVISEAIHSGVDLLAALIALFAVSTSGKPADEEHPYGHGKVENLSGTIEALLIFLAAGWIIYEAARRLIEPRPMHAAAWGVAVMGFSAVANVVVSQMLFKVARETDSVALEADGWHLRTDVYTSVGVFVGLGIVMLHERVLPRVELHWMDPVAAIAVALLIIRAAYQLTVKSARDLMDVSLPPEEEAAIRRYIASLGPAVRGFHKLRTRKAGAARFVDFHLLVDPEMSVGNSHEVSDRIAAHIQQEFPNSSVTVHIEPYEGD